MTEFDEARERRLWSLGRALRRLDQVRLDEVSRPKEIAYYRVANDILRAVAETPARTVTGMKVKAEAILWCHGGRLEFGADPTAADRLLASLVDDLVAA